MSSTAASEAQRRAAKEEAERASRQRMVPMRQLRAEKNSTGIFVTFDLLRNAWNLEDVQYENV